jgi:hypothetical protein
VFKNDGQVERKDRFNPGSWRAFYSEPLLELQHIDNAAAMDVIAIRPLPLI